MAAKNPKKIILAISGGIDSVVLLELAARKFGKFSQDNLTKTESPIFPEDFLVAHFDHGIRGENSRKDAEFVENLAKKYRVDFVKKNGNLPKKASEESARKKRYDFLFSLAKNPSQKIVTAHHADDLLETITMNLLRGDGWRGLAPMRSSAKIARPMLKMTKSEIVRFAIENNLTWREDETNSSMRFFRNRVREFLAGIRVRDKNFAQKIIKLSEKQQKLRYEIEQEVDEILLKNFSENLKKKSDNLHQKLTKNNQEIGGKFARYFFIMIDEKSALEILRKIFAGKLTRPELKEILLFLKIGKIGKKMRIGKFEIILQKREFFLKKLS